LLQFYFFDTCAARVLLLEEDRVSSHVVFAPAKPWL